MSHGNFCHSSQLLSKFKGKDTPLLQQSSAVLTGSPSVAKKCFVVVVVVVIFCCYFTGIRSY